MNCHCCKIDLPENAKFCPNCGTKVQLLCPHCKIEVPENAKFCHQCGAVLQQKTTKTQEITVLDQNEKSEFKKQIDALIDKEKYTEALTVCEQKLQQDPNNLEALNGKIDSLACLENLEEAFSCLGEMQKRFPDEPLTLLDTFVLLFLSEKYDLALETSEKLLPKISQLDKDDQGMTFVLRAFILFTQKGENQQALEELKQAEKFEGYFNQESKELYLQVKTQLENLNNQEIIIGNDEFRILYQNFSQNFIEFIQTYCEEKNLHTAVSMVSAAKLTKLFNASITNGFNTLREILQPIGTEKLAEELNAYEEDLRTKTSRELEPFLDEINELKKEVIENTASSSTSGFIEGAVKGYFFGVLGLLDSFSEDKKSNNAINEWNTSFQEIIQTFINSRVAFLGVLDSLTEKYPINYTFDDDIVDQIEAENSGSNSNLLPVLQEAAGAEDKVYFTPDIPAEKLGEAKKSYAFIKSDEKVLCLFDSTLFGGADDGAVFTDKRFYWHELMDAPKSVEYSSITNVWGKEKLTLKVKGETDLYVDFTEDENKLLKRMLNAVLKNIC